MPIIAIAAASTLMFKNLGISDTQITFFMLLAYLPISAQTNPIDTFVIRLNISKYTACDLRLRFRPTNPAPPSHAHRSTDIVAPDV